MSATTQILKRLQEAGFSQTEISRRAGIPQPTLSKWAAGKAAKAADAALRLLQLENEELEKTARGSEEKQPPAPAQQAPAAINSEAQGAAHA